MLSVPWSHDNASVQRSNKRMQPAAFGVWHDSRTEAPRLMRGR